MSKRNQSVLTLTITAAILAIIYLLPANWPEAGRWGALVSIPLSLFLFSYFWLPIRFKRNLSIRARYEFEPFHPAREVVPEELWSHIRETVACLDPCGFRLVGHFRKSGFVPGFIGFTTLMETGDGTTLVKAMSTFLTNPKSGKGDTTLAFFTESADGTEIVTANNKILPGTPHSKTKRRIVLWMPELRFPSDLYEYHQRLVERFAVLPKRDILDRHPHEYMKKYSESELAHWVKTGYYKLDPSGELYRLTWKGAALTAWKQLWPIKPIRRAWRKHETNKLLRKLEE
jgi:hypothetical protein